MSDETGQSVPVVICPKGVRWPWYPVYRFQGAMDAKGTVTPTSAATRTRVGLRGWITRGRSL